MPTVNIYQNTKEFEQKLRLATPGLKRKLADLLSGESIKLNTEEISVRIIDTIGQGMLAKVELEIHAAAFKERVDKQDEVCLSVQKYLIDALGTDVKVWLILSELGHSWQNT